MTLCKHAPHKVIDWIKDPKFSTDQILINVDAISPNIEHYIFQFSSPGSKKKYGWFYLGGSVIRRHKTQPNGRGKVHVVPMNKREDFEPTNNCEHAD